MKNKFFDIALRLREEKSISEKEIEYLVNNITKENLEYINGLAFRRKQEVFGNVIYLRALAEISNICKNDCLYCGIRKSNKSVTRYKMSGDEIIKCCIAAYKTGFRTFVLQGGENNFYSDELLCEVIKRIKTDCSGCVVTLSLGERSRESCRKLFFAGADRYLLREETADKEHYKMLHPDNMSFENRIACLKALKEIGYQTGCGFMVGSPFQKAWHIAKDIKFIERFKPHMVGVGPFVPAAHTPFESFKGGSAELTCLVISILRLMNPHLLLPATTALATFGKNGRQRGILSGANVVMPNVTPCVNRERYTLYNNKALSGSESAEGLCMLYEELESIGQKPSFERGDYKE